MVSKRLSAIQFFFVITAGLFSLAAQAELKTVDYVDVSKYLGDWYQISHIPLFFEGSGKCACARQRLTATDTTGVVDVFNTCNDGYASGNLRSIKGQATVLDTTTNAKLSVKFEGVRFTGSYWIIGLDSQYRYAVVSDSNQYSLYILSKTPTLADDLYKEAVATAATQLDTSKLELTDQTSCNYP